MLGNPNALTKRQLGDTAMHVTAVSLGGAGLGGIFGPVGDAEGVAAVETALALGMNYLDTSPKYGEAERRMGMALRGVPRETYYISSKVGTHPGRPLDYSAEAARWTVHNSLGVLGLDYLDLCYIHEPDPQHLDVALAPGGAMETLLDLKAEGIIRAIGIGVQEHDLHRRAMETGELDVSMIVTDYTLIRQNADDIFELATKHKVGLVNGAALAMGLLSGREPDTIGTDRWSPSQRDVLAAKRVHAWCSERDVPVLALALQFCLRQERLGCTLIGAATPAEVLGCWDALKVDIPAAAWDALPDLLNAIRYSEGCEATRREAGSGG